MKAVHEFWRKSWLLPEGLSAMLAELYQKRGLDATGFCRLHHHMPCLYSGAISALIGPACSTSL
jgi:hypothetical protein